MLNSNGMNFNEMNEHIFFLELLDANKKGTKARGALTEQPEFNIKVVLEKRILPEPQLLQC